MPWKGGNMIIDLDRRWRARPDLACLGLSETYFPPGPGKPGDRPTMDAQAAWDEAKAVCRRCPVMHQCRRDTMGERYGVWGGLDQYQRWQVRSRMTAAAKRWPASRRRSWGRVVHELRSRGDGWVMVSVRTGLPVGLAQTLYEEHEPPGLKPKPAAAPVHLGRTCITRPEWPSKAGPKDAWAFHQGTIKSAFYRAQTPDGEWLLMAVQSGGSHSIVWLRAEDVKIFHPQEVVIREKGKAVNRYAA